jgi:hypothetical protein
MSSFLWQWAKDWFAKLQGIELEDSIPEQLTPMDRCRLLYETIDWKSFTEYKQSIGHGRTIPTVHQNIEACINDLASHISSLEHGGYVLSARCDYKLIKKPLNRFFITADGFYLDSLHAKLQELSAAVIALCQAVDDAKHIEHDTKTYNQRMLNSLFHVLIEIGLSLEETSAAIKNHA